MKKLLWVALATTASSLCAALAMRVADRVWRRVAHQPPPEVPRWARLLVARPLERGVIRRVGPATP